MSEMPRRSTVAVVLGTRPEIIKLAGVVHEIGDRASVLDTGQHYDDQMSKVFFRQLGVPEPFRCLAVGGLSRAAQIAEGVQALERAFAELDPAVVVVQGDTNSALAGALAANALELPVVHVEAGLRSYDRRMPEEHNRVLIDHVADFLAAGTIANQANLEREGIGAARVEVTGNTVVEATLALLPAPPERRRLLESYAVATDGYVLATIHRPENTDDPARLAAVLSELAALSELTTAVIFPMHPRTAAAIARHGLAALLDGLLVVAPLDYSTFLALAAEAAVIVSDSGGVQEEVTVLKRPLVVVRRSTERPESLEHFATLVEPGPEIGIAARAAIGDPGLRERLGAIASPYGDGSASARIAERVNELYP
jgi:UDP-N-acetylglucosamine 2-epimerase (non-hydrolysing)